MAPRLRPFVVVPESPATFPRPVRNVFEAQVALARRAISSGSIDAALGSQTRRAISVFQETQHLPVTGALNADTVSYTHLVRLAGRDVLNFRIGFTVFGRGLGTSTSGQPS